LDKIWLKNYQKNVAEQINLSAYSSLDDLMLQACKKYAKQTAYISMGTAMSYEELEQSSKHLASYFQQLNLAKGTRVALILPNILQYPVCLLAALRAGLVVVNTNPMYTANELIHQLEDAQAEVAIVFVQCVPALRQALPQLPHLKHLIIAEVGDLFPWAKRWLFNLLFRLKHSKYAHSLPGSIRLRTALKLGSNTEFKDANCDSEDIAFLQYTGGTTGIAKGAMLSHRNMIANVLQTSAWISNVPMTENDLIITGLPLYHVFSLMANCLLFLHLGVRNLLIADPRRTQNLLKQIHHYQPTAITGVNTLFSSILNHPKFKAEDFTQLKIALAGGMALSATIAERWKAATQHPIIEAYGLTEASPAVCINPLDHAQQGSIGLPVPSTEVSIRDEQGKECSIGESGELCVRGPQIMQGYWNNPEETSKVFYSDGFLRTGDFGHIDEQGFVYLTDRIKDLIIISGFNVYPHEIEGVIAQMDKVLEVAVVGVQSKSGNERIKACIVARDPSLTSQEVLEHCHRYLTSYKIPKIVEFYPELPKTNVGKILKRMLR
jgi:long-chain acyl-CoA synthetase